MRPCSALHTSLVSPVFSLPFFSLSLSLPSPPIPPPTRPHLSPQSPGELAVPQGCPTKKKVFVCERKGVSVCACVLTPCTWTIEQHCSVDAYVSGVSKVPLIMPCGLYLSLSLPFLRTSASSVLHTSSLRYEKTSRQVIFEPAILRASRSTATNQAFKLI